MGDQPRVEIARTYNVSHRPLFVPHVKDHVEPLAKQVGKIVISVHRLHLPTWLPIVGIEKKHS